MNQSKHTPGPWEIKKSHELSNSFVIFQEKPLDNYGTKETIVDVCYGEANAALIASAPEQAARIERLEAQKAELLEVSKNLLDFVIVWDLTESPSWTDRDQRALQKANLIIAKAQKQ